MTKAEASILEKRSTAIKKRYERRYIKVFYKALREQKAPVIAAAKKDIYSAYAQIALINSDSLFAVYKAMYLKVVPHEADREYARLAVTKAFGVNIDWLSDISDFLNDYMLNNIVRPMTARTMERMYQTLRNGIALGQSNDEIVKALSDTKIDKVRARLIARTESTRATEFAGHTAAGKHDFKIKRFWLSIQNRRTRGNPSPTGADDKADHYHMNMQEVLDDEPFTDHRSSVQMMYPGDSTLGAQASDLCNCRCSAGREALRDKDGNLIMK